MTKPVKISAVINDQSIVSSNLENVIQKKNVRAKKSSEGNEIIRTRKGNPRTNKPVKLPDNPTWIKQPNIIMPLMRH